MGRKWVENCVERFSRKTKQNQKWVEKCVGHPRNRTAPVRMQLQLISEQPMTDHASKNFELRLATLCHLALLAVFCLNAAHVPLRVQVVVMYLKKRPHLVNVHLALYLTR